MIAGAPMDPLTVVPDAMMTVTLNVGLGPQVINAIACRYIPATRPIGNMHHRVVAIEVIHDPFNPIPLEPYFCNAQTLQVLIVPASALKSVRPYQLPGR